MRTGWRPGPAGGLDGPVLVSYTEYISDSVRHLPGIYFAAERLRDACAELEGAVGVTTWYQLLRGRGGSLSAWTDEAALRRFVSLPYHLEIMRRYRTRGSIRAVKWRADAFDLGRAFEHGATVLTAEPTQ